MPAGLQGSAILLLYIQLLGNLIITQLTSTVVKLLSQQIAFKNLVQRNRQTEQQATRPPPPNSIIHLPFIIVNTSKKTVIDCSISSDKYVTPHSVWAMLLPDF